MVTDPDHPFGKEVGAKWQQPTGRSIRWDDDLVGEESLPPEGDADDDRHG
jgi:hypothetical protein